MEKLNSLIDIGMIFTYATARSLSSVSKLTNKLKLKHPVIVYNGAFVIDPNSKEIYREGYWLEIMPKKATKANAIFQSQSSLGCNKVANGKLQKIVNLVTL